MIRSDNPLLHVRRRHLRDETEVVIGRSAARVILGVVTLALAIALALSGSGHAKDIIELIRRLPRL